MSSANAQKDAKAPPSESGVRVVTCEAPQSLYEWVVSTTLTFVLVHYLLWGVAAAAFLGLLATLGGMIGLALAVALFLAYIPTFCDRRERRLTGTWDSFRKGTFWRLVAKYAEMTLVRTHELDPSKQYVMGWVSQQVQGKSPSQDFIAARLQHPHGILILSRIAMYGGYFEG